MQEDAERALRASTLSTVRHWATMGLLELALILYTAANVEPNHSTGRVGCVRLVTRVDARRPIAVSCLSILRGGEDKSCGGLPPCAL